MFSSYRERAAFEAAQARWDNAEPPDDEPEDDEAECEPA